MVSVNLHARLQMTSQKNNSLLVYTIDAPSQKNDVSVEIYVTCSLFKLIASVKEALRDSKIKNCYLQANESKII